MLKIAPRSRRVWTPFFVLLVLSCAEPIYAAGVNAKQGPKIMVPPVLGIARSTSLKSHYPIVHALQQRFGKRVVDDTLVLQAQKKLHVWPRALRQPKAVARLSEAVDAERALVISASRRGLSVAVYVDVHKPPTRIIKIKRINAKRIRKKQARRIAKIIARKATLLLSAEPFPQLTSVSPKAKSKTAQTAVPQSTETQSTGPKDGDESWGAIDVQLDEDPGAPDAAAEILAEERRERELKNSVNTNKNKDLSLYLMAGFALARRQLELSGSQAPWVIPVQAGLLPYLSLSAALFPLRFVPSLQASAYKDLAIKLNYQRAVYRSMYQGEEIAVDDDNMQLRISYSQALWSWSKSPSLGLGFGYGWQRAEIQSDAALLSSRYSYFEVFSQLKQPLWRDKLAFLALLSARQPVAADSGLRPVPSWSAELWLTGKWQPWWFAGLGLRSQGYSAWRAAQLRVDEQDNSLQFEIGGYY